MVLLPMYVKNLFVLGTNIKNENIVINITKYKINLLIGLYKSCLPSKEIYGESPSNQSELIG